MEMKSVNLSMELTYIKFYVTYIHRHTYIHIHTIKLENIIYNHEIDGNIHGNTL